MTLDARSNARVYGSSLAGIVGSNPTGCMDVGFLSMLSQVELLRRGDRWSGGMAMSVV
jgi:hypothetical protein